LGSASFGELWGGGPLDAICVICDEVVKGMEGRGFRGGGDEGLIVGSGVRGGPFGLGGSGRMFPLLHYMNKK
jgi:hypothetical protein